MRWICATQASHIDDTAWKSTRAVEEIWTKNEQYPRERGNGGKPLERMHTNARKCKCTEVHARARVRMNIHENANARTVGPINELLVVGECCFWTVSEESHACFSVPYR